MFSFGSYVNTANALSNSEARRVETQKRSETAHKALQDVVKEKTGINSSLREERLRSEQLQKENEALKVSLQAKKDAEAKAAQEAAKVIQPAPVAVISGNKQTWLAESGIPEAHWGYVDAIVSRESGWNPNAVNKSSGACGLGQQLPCGKWAGAWNDPVAALKAMTGYVNGRYGGWAGANAFWNQNHWY